MLTESPGLDRSRRIGALCSRDDGDVKKMDSGRPRRGVTPLERGEFISDCVVVAGVLM